MECHKTEPLGKAKCSDPLGFHSVNLLEYAIFTEQYSALLFPFGIRIHLFLDRLDIASADVSLFHQLRKKAAQLFGRADAHAAVEIALCLLAVFHGLGSFALMHQCADKTAVNRFLLRIHADGASADFLEFFIRSAVLQAFR